MAITDLKLDEVMEELYHLREENQSLKLENDFLQQKADRYEKLRKEYDEFYTKEYIPRIDECNRLFGELFDIKHMNLWEFAEKYCNDDQLEQAGHDFAKSLLGGA